MNGITWRRLGWCLALLLCIGAVVVVPVRGAEDEAVPPEARYVTMFNQSLYFGALDRPRALAYDAKNREIWVADAGLDRIAVYRTDGVELFSFAPPEHVQDPVRLAVMPNGGLAVLDGRRAHIFLFNYRGEYRGEVALPQLGEQAVIGAMAYDAAGQLYVADNKNARVLVFRSDGSLKFEFGSRGADEGQFIGICAIVIGADGTIYVLDQRAIAVQVFDAEGNFVRGWGKHEMGKQNVSLPSGLAVDLQGRVYVSDELRQQVKVFAPNGDLLLAFGGIGAGPGQLAFPTDVAVDEEGHVYVAERRTSRVQAFEIVGLPALPQN
jgi:DNA-binding beta-propeller fold protein YncE